MERIRPRLYPECATCSHAGALSAKYADKLLENVAHVQNYSHPHLSISCTQPVNEELGIQMEMRPWLSHDDGSAQLEYLVSNEVICPAKLATKITEKKQQIETAKMELTELEGLVGK